MNPHAATSGRVADPAADASAERRCGNCGAALQGLHCHACGQPARSLVRHFRSVVGDFVDTVFNVDGRLLRTLGPLLLRPGFLSLEYLAGRRVRYVSPVRLFVFISLLAFLAGRLNIEPEVAGTAVDPPAATADFSQAASVDAVLAQRERALREFDARRFALDAPGVAVGLAGARAAIEQVAQARIDALRTAGGADTAAATDANGVATAAPVAGRPRDTPLEIRLGQGVWHPRDNPLQLAWLPEAANAQLNLWLQRGVDNLLELRGDRSARQRLGEYVLELLPQTLFVLLPVFALLLKLAYAFRRRLYMEHLIVALHSHAFLSLAVLLLALLGLLHAALAPGLARDGTSALSIALAAWMPLYLLLMQKRVYREGWGSTLLKYALLGTAYTALIGAGVVVTLLIGLVAM